MIKQFCAECGKENIPNSNGSRNKCCNGIGYWVNLDPPYKLHKRNGYWLYINQLKWPKGKKATLPQDEQNV